jgi:hypothetical protein
MQPSFPKLQKTRLGLPTVVVICCSNFFSTRFLELQPAIACLRLS